MSQHALHHAIAFIKPILPSDTEVAEVEARGQSLIGSQEATQLLLLLPMLLRAEALGIRRWRMVRALLEIDAGPEPGPMQWVSSVRVLSRTQRCRRFDSVCLSEAALEEGAPN